MIFDKASIKSILKNTQGLRQVIENDSVRLCQNPSQAKLVADCILEEIQTSPRDKQKNMLLITHCMINYSTSMNILEFINQFAKIILPVTDAISETKDPELIKDLDTSLKQWREKHIFPEQLLDRCF